MKAFGDLNWAVELDRIDTPVGEKCIFCEEPIVEGDVGVVMPFLGVDEETNIVPQHKECVLRGIFGSVGHQKKTCSCFGGTEEDPPGMTKREAAKAAAKLAGDLPMPPLD